METYTASPITIKLRGDLKFSELTRPPHTFLRVVQYLMPGVRILAANASPDASPAQVMLCAHVLECLLKAYLTRDGSVDKIRGRDSNKKSIRHNLSELWKRASKDHLPVQNTPPAWVDHLNHLHNDPYILRYLNDCGGIYIQPTEPITTALEGLIEIVQQAM